MIIVEQSNLVQSMIEEIGTSIGTLRCVPVTEMELKIPIIKKQESQYTMRVAIPSSIQYLALTLSNASRRNFPNTWAGRPSWGKVTTEYAFCNYFSFYYFDFQVAHFITIQSRHSIIIIPLDNSWFEQFSAKLTIIQEITSIGTLQCFAVKE